MQSRTAKEIPAEALQQFRPFRSLSEKEAISSRQKAAREIAASLAKELKERFKASRVQLFGSVIGSDFGAWSDIDLAAWGIPAGDYFRAVAFASGYSSMFKIDLVDAEDCQPSLLQHIIRQGVEL
ncbi:nucleotidyltransferase family protein [Geobacter sp. SVR]|uniref:nucleotidyltransferase family protein n=1 Tax=Geobacter sp. SVR TaxID=2495594 RepID=UPI00143F01D0|nr:nucleotidyltransferase domain-containing protein [Geobacter sp. SVR]BCS53684.1 nucleotidyltransferase [Geobacter sp. SVR]GCF84119.1 nucleotidyltransferase [Geobacter sp. SVR]